MDGAARQTTAGLGRREFLAFLSMVMALAAVGIDVMLPAFNEMRLAFGLASDSNEVARTVTAYLLGMATGPMLYGSLADRVGRRPVLWLGGGVYVVGAVLSALAPTLATLLLARFLWGLGASAGRVIAFAIIRDTQKGDEMARTVSYVMAVFILVPIIGPSLGSVVVALGPWRWVFWFGAIAGALVLLWSSRLQETLKAANRQTMSFATIGKTAHRMLGSRSTLAPLLAMACVRGIMASYLASSQLIIAEVFDRSDQFPLIFGAVAVVLGVASFLNGRLLSSRTIHQVLGPVSGFYLIIAVAVLAVTLAADGRPGFWVFMPLYSLGLGCQMLFTPNLNTLVLEPMGDVAGTASALIVTLTTASGAVLGALIDSQVTDAVTPMAIALLLSSMIIGGLLTWSRPATDALSVP